MTRTRLAAAALGAAAIVACVGDDPAPIIVAPGDGADASVAPGPDASDTPDAGSPDTGSPDTGSPDAPACDGGLTACGGACVSLDGDADNCGRCGHDCGGGTCDQGVCAPVELVASFTGSTNLAAVDGTYYLTIGGEVHACTDVGCKKPTVLANFTDYPLNAGLAAGGGRVIFAASPNNNVSQYQGLFSCPDTGCTSLPGDPLVMAGKYIGIDALEIGGKARDRVVYGYQNNGTKYLGTATCAAAGCTNKTVFSGVTPTPTTSLVTVDDDNVYFTYASSGTKLAMCPATGCVGGNAIDVGMIAGSGGTVTAIRALGGVVYAAVLASNPTVIGCQVKAGGACKAVGTGIPSFTAFDVDDSGFYYGSDIGGSLETCKLTGCGGGPTKLRPAVVGTAPTYEALRVSGRYIYWIQTLSGTRSVWRLAKP